MKLKMYATRKNVVTQYFAKVAKHVQIFEDKNPNIPILSVDAWI